MRTIILALFVAIAASSALAKEDISPENMWGFYEPNFRKGFQAPHCPDALVDGQLQEALRELHKSGNELEKALTGTDKNRKWLAAKAIRDARDLYYIQIAICRHELMKAKRTDELKLFNRSIQPLM